MEAILVSLILFLTSTSPVPTAASPVLEDGYTVTTVLDGNKLPLPIHPFSLLPSPNGPQLLFLLDSANSVFYRTPLPLSQDGEIGRLAGKGGSGYSDGEPMEAMFGHPRSFALDSAGNVYVADRSNHVVRKIAPSGITTTIAGGYQRKTGKVDGPALNASFSDDFELAFIPKMCALLICDRGNSLVRQINLKQDDCRQESQSGLGTASVSLIAVISVFFGSIIGIVASPYIRSCGIYRDHGISKTWRHCQTSLGMMLLTLFSAIKSVAAKAISLYLLSYKLMGSVLSYFLCVHKDPRQEKHVPFRKPVSLIDSDVTDNYAGEASNNYTDQLKDLICFGGDMGIVESHSPKQEFKNGNSSNENVGKLNDMISSNLSGFVEQANQQGQLEMSSIANSGVFKRKTGMSAL